MHLRIVKATAPNPVSILKMMVIADRRILILMISVLVPIIWLNLTSFVYKMKTMVGKLVA